MEDIKVVLSNKELNNLNNDKYKNNKEKGDKCNICLCNYDNDDDIIILKCNHMFHKKCIEEWLSNNSNKCPVCRNEVAKGKPII